MATGQQPEATAEAVIANPTENNRHAKSFSGNYDHYVADAATASLFRATHTQHTQTKGTGGRFSDQSLTHCVSGTTE